MSVREWLYEFCESTQLRVSQSSGISTLGVSEYVICTRIVRERNLQFIIGRRCLKRRKLHKIKRLFRRGNSSLTVRILLLDISLPLFEVVSQALKVSDEFHSKEKALTPAEKTPSSEAPCHTTRRHFCQLGHSHMQEIHIPSTVRLL